MLLLLRFSAIITDKDKEPKQYIVRKRREERHTDSQEKVTGEETEAESMNTELDFWLRLSSGLRSSPCSEQ